MAKLCPARTVIIIILSIAVLYALFQYVKTHDSINDTFKISHCNIDFYYTSPTL